MENSKQIQNQEDASDIVFLLPAVGERTQEAPESEPDTLMATGETHKWKPIKESAYLKE